jgi:hypothetical protein
MMMRMTHLTMAKEGDQGLGAEEEGQNHHQHHQEAGPGFSALYLYLFICLGMMSNETQVGMLRILDIFLATA